MDTIDARRGTVRSRIENCAAQCSVTASRRRRRRPATRIFPNTCRSAGRAANGFPVYWSEPGVTEDFAGVWVDSRYWTQAEGQLAGTGIELMKIGGAGSSAHLDWLAEHVAPGARVAVDGAVLGLSGARALQSALSERGIQLRTDLDLLNDVWADRAALPAQPVYEHLPLRGNTARRQTRRGTATDEATGASHHWISTLDDIASGGGVAVCQLQLVHICCSTQKAPRCSSPKARSTQSLHRGWRLTVLRFADDQQPPR